MPKYSHSMERLMEALGRLPGIGARTAERLAFHLLMTDETEAMALSEAIRDVKTKIHPCPVCFNLAESDRCDICSDSARDGGILCVVELPKDLLAIESTGAYRGVYHVLTGAISPMDGVEPEDLTIGALLKRAAAEEVHEVILATNPTVAGDATALYVTERLSGKDVKVSRLARGLPAGGQIEYASASILSDAIHERREM